MDTIPAYSSDLFEYQRDAILMITEITRLGHTAGGKAFAWLDGKGTIGFTMVSARTGERLDLTLKAVLWSETDLIEAWEFQLTPHSQAKVPHMSGLRVVVLNR